MKTLYLVRHAKSSWKHEELKDIERPLKKRGVKNAQYISKLLKNGNNIPELMVSSPAVRAFDTAKIFAERFGISEKDIIKNEKLYMADFDEFISVISELPDKVKKGMIFGHNPGITYIASTLGISDIDNIPTCGVIRIDLDISSWTAISNTPGNQVFFEYPKKYKETDNKN